MTALTPEHVSSLSDTAVLDALREAEIRHRRMYRDEVVLVAKIEARGIATSRGVHVGTVALLRDILNLGSAEARRMVAHAEALCGTVTPTGAHLDPLDHPGDLGGRWIWEGSTAWDVRASTRWS